MSTSTDIEAAKQRAIERVESASQRAAESAAKGGMSKNTRYRYERAWQMYMDWLQGTGLDLDASDTSPELVATYLEDIRSRKDLSDSTLRVYYAGIRHIFEKKHGESLPDHSIVHQYLKQVSVDQAGRSNNGAPALYVDDLKRILSTCNPKEEGAIAFRDRAMLLVGYVCALRRSEITQIQRRHLTRIRNDGAPVSRENAGPGHAFVLTVPRQKNDPTGAGHDRPIPATDQPTSPARSLHLWITLYNEMLEAEGHELSPDDPIFCRLGHSSDLHQPLGDESVYKMLVTRAERAGLGDEGYTPHSLRAGFMTEATRGGATLEDAMQVSGHKDHGVAMGYVSPKNLFENRAIQAVGL